MRSLEFTRTFWIVIGLALLMAATRFHHEGTPFALPDASLAVFFLGGWYLRQSRAFAGYLLGAFLIDYIAIAYMGVSDYCVSPAYGFLIPTYAALWWAGRWAAVRDTGAGFPMTQTTVALLCATSLAFVISNGSFFLFSGRLVGADGWAYSLGVARDYPGYLSTVVMYSGLAFLGAALFRAIPALERWQTK